MSSTLRKRRPTSAFWLPLFLIAYFSVFVVHFVTHNGYSIGVESPNTWVIHINFRVVYLIWGIVCMSTTTDRVISGERRVFVVAWVRWDRLTYQRWMSEMEKGKTSNKVRGVVHDSNINLGVVLLSENFSFWKVYLYTAFYLYEVRDRERESAEQGEMQRENSRDASLRLWLEFRSRSEPGVERRRMSRDYTKEEEDNLLRQKISLFCSGK